MSSAKEPDDPDGLAACSVGSRNDQRCQCNARNSQNQSGIECPHCSRTFTRQGINRHIGYRHPDAPLLPRDSVALEDPSSASNNSNGSIRHLPDIEEQQPHSQQQASTIPEYIQNHFQRGFGAPLLNADAEQPTNSAWYDRWKKAMRLQGRQYALPQGSVGRHFVRILANEIQAVANDHNSSERIFVFCATVLQRDKGVSGGTDIRRIIQKRIDMWNEEHFDEMLTEAEKCDRRLSKKRKPDDSDHEIRIFTRLVMQGKLKDATRWITKRSNGGVLTPETILDNGMTVFETLKMKHPPQFSPEPDIFLDNEPLPHMPNVDITSNHIESVARRIRGSAGPSGTDAEQWRNMLLRYGSHSQQLREAVASLARRMANGIVDWNQIRAILARRGVALDKCPGVRPIGVGEMLQRILAKTMALLTAEDLKEACGSDQLAAGTKSGIEGAIHAMEEIFAEEDQECLLLVDAANAFNTMSRPLAIWNARILWPRCAKFLFNTYRGFPVVLFRQSEITLHSQEGTTQGDPLGMLMYSVGTLPLIKSLKTNRWVQNWYADDSSCCGKLRDVRQWFNLLQEQGPRWGYYAEPEKSYLVVKPGFETEANQIFRDLNVKIVNSKRFLGGFIGPIPQKEEYVRSKVRKWIEDTKKFALAAQKSPQAAHTAFTKSLQFEWAFLQRVVEGCQEEYAPLWETIRHHLIPNLVGREVEDPESELMTMPARLGGLGIKNPRSMSESASEISKKAVDVLVSSIKNGTPLNYSEHWTRVERISKDAKKARADADQQRSTEIIEQLQPHQQRVLKRIIAEKASHWLTVLPNPTDGYDLSPTQFRDALALRYGHTPMGLPQTCDGCSNQFDVSHALNCKKGGLVKRGHDYVRDETAALAAQAWGGVTFEPLIREAGANETALVGDIRIEGVWESGRPAFFDNRIVNADAASYTSREWSQIAQQAAQEKHHKYDQACEDLRGSFTPLVCSCDGVLHREFHTLLKRTADRLAEKWKRPYTQVLGWVRVRIEIAIIKAVSLRLRGARRKAQYLGMDDGAALPVMIWDD
ncbi:unnamed protein product [Nesidiocoris tenuis]|uniref:Uncharacterized protein n=1 Tax=Nesidiocoris tenuis TaxID=355587 RepID=A0A6H5HCT1_9HEMI|nr:unnamed protein product [Nesidiocoris tenuis]